jgi:hypothetical protein
MGPIGGALGYLSGLQAQQNLWAQQGMVNWPAGTANTTNTNVSYVVSMAPVEAVPLKPKGPETALEWLDRRVSEIRLPLAA